MTHTEDDFLQLSALQHFIFCERQCALIHIEQQWEENLFTAEGRVMHEKVHDAPAEKRKDARIEYGVQISSQALGLSGIADVVEFHRGDDGSESWMAFPVEYKRGKPKADDSDKVQLCAQAMCLEEMLKQNVERGAIFYSRTRRRFDVAFDDELRRITTDTAARLHDLIRKGVTPPPWYMPKCDSCSLLSVCLPKISGKYDIVSKYYKAAVEQRVRDNDEKTP